MSIFQATSLPVTSLYAGIIGVGFVLSSLNVALTRVSLDKMYGEDKDSDLQHKNRAQGNFIQYGAFGVILLALLEYNSILSHDTLWWWGFAFTTLRYTHAFQLLAPKTLPLLLCRAGPFLITLVLLGYASAKLIFHGLGK